MSAVAICFPLEHIDIIRIDYTIDATGCNAWWRRWCSRYVLYSCQCFFDQPRNIEDGIGDGHVRGFERGDLALGSSGVARDDRSGVAHALSRRCCAPGNEGDDGFGHGFNIFGGIFLIASAYFTAHDDGLCAWIGLEQLQVIDEGRADDGVTADANAGGLPDTGLCQ